MNFVKFILIFFITENKTKLKFLEKIEKEFNVKKQVWIKKNSF